MLLDAIILLVLSALLIAGGIALLRHWRAIGEAAGQIIDKSLLFGPVGEAILVPIGLMGVLGGVWAAAQSINHLLSI